MAVEPRHALAGGADSHGGPADGAQPDRPRAGGARAGPPGALASSRMAMAGGAVGLSVAAVVYPSSIGFVSPAICSVRRPSMSRANRPRRCGLTGRLGSGRPCGRRFSVPCRGLRLSRGVERRRAESGATRRASGPQPAAASSRPPAWWVSGLAFGLIRPIRGAAALRRDEGGAGWASAAGRRRLASGVEPVERVLPGTGS
jgi:hypothetical protein